MTFAEFKNTVENLDIPWKFEGGMLYCPSCMFPKQGYIICGTTLEKYFNMRPKEMEQSLKYIKDFNSRIVFEDGYYIYKGDGYEVKIKNSK